VRRLSRLYAASPEACARHIHRFWNTSAAEEIALLASAGDWVGIRKRLEEFRAGLVHRAALRSPAWAIKHTLNVIGRRVSHLRRPNGLHVALLGCDGAGKSTVITAMLDAFGVGFSNSAVHGFVPALMQRALHGSNRRTDTPHALEPRSAAVSIARALMYWFPYYSIGYVFRYVELARSTFILNDRHFVDVLVDKRRYRYGGPEWLLRTIWRLIPKPDVILLLDAPPAVLFARKTETSFAEVSRQCLAYRELAKSIPLIKIVNAERPLPAVLLQINRLLVAFLEERALSRM
jgi:thymidylate kinase